MHLFNTGSPRPKLKVGKKYQIIGYHTGDFTGECIALELHVAIFRVTGKASGLKLGQDVAVYLDSARGARVKINEC